MNLLLLLPCDWVCDWLRVIATENKRKHKQTGYFLLQSVRMCTAICHKSKRKYDDNLPQLKLISYSNPFCVPTVDCRLPPACSVFTLNHIHDIFSSSLCFYSFFFFVSVRSVLLCLFAFVCSSRVWCNVRTHTHTVHTRTYRMVCDL